MILYKGLPYGFRYVMLAVYFAFIAIQYNFANTNQEVIVRSHNHLQPADTINWQILSDLEYVESSHDTYGTVYLPKMSNSLKKLNNKTVIIKGYLVPVDRKTWALSRNTYAACFFCGKAGPETVLGLEFLEEPSKLKLDAFVVMKGVLIINEKNVDEWMYKLDQAQILKMN